MASKPIVGCTYRHFKGNLYTVLAIGIHSETGEEFVVYKNFQDVDSLNLKVWIRPIAMWDEEVQPGLKRFTLFT